MDNDKVKAVCAGYAKLIHNETEIILGRRLEADRLSDHYAGSNLRYIPLQARLKHLLFMTEEIPRLLDAGRVEKAMRWLGFLQGACWAAGIETLHDAKLRNAPEGASYDKEA